MRIDHLNDRVADYMASLETVVEMKS
jgi:hypothetical protein